MKTTVKTEAQKQDFIELIESTEIKGSYRCEFSQIRRKRSLSANNYLWLCITIGSQETGNDRMDLYYYFLEKYPTTKEVEISDVVHFVTITSSAFNSGQMALLIDNVRRELNMMGIATPEAYSDECMKIYEYYRDRSLI